VSHSARRGAVRVLAAIAVCAMFESCLGPVSCGPPPRPTGQFGIYEARNKYVVLPAGDSLTVYRVKYWVFDDGPPRLQMEYALASAGDTGAVLAMDRKLWPLFAPYVEHLHLDHALLTATKLEVVTGPGGAFVSQRHSYGKLIDRGADGLWRMDAWSEPLPPEDSSGVPRIFEASGARMAFPTKLPSVTP
jgi:hypothetical protein